MFALSFAPSIAHHPDVHSQRVAADPAAAAAAAAAEDKEAARKAAEEAQKKVDEHSVFVANVDCESRG